MLDLYSRRFYIYAMLCEDEDGNGYMKIGHSGQVNKRLTSIRVACPIPAKYFALMQAPSREKAIEIERLLHKRFAHRRISGEWFKFDFVSPEDKKDFADGSREVFALHFLEREQRWWSKLSVKELDAYNKERREAFWNSKHRDKILRKRAYQMRRDAAWKELSY